MCKLQLVFTSQCISSSEAKDNSRKRKSKKEKEESHLNLTIACETRSNGINREPCAEEFVFMPEFLVLQMVSKEAVRLTLLQFFIFEIKKNSIETMLLHQKLVIKFNS
jgi:hypothetical protein